jgi:hypothetical protein
MSFQNFNNNFLKQKKMVEEETNENIELFFENLIK